MMFSPPAVWRAVAGLEGAREALAELRCVRSSGDVLLAIDHELLRRVLPMGCAVLSVYGATEAPRSCNGSCKDGSGVIWSCVEIRGQVDSGHGARAAFLNAECADGKTIIRVEVRKYDFGVGPVTVRWRRWRPGKPGERTDTWEPCDDGTCIGLWEGQGYAFVKSLPGARPLTLSWRRAMGSPCKELSTSKYPAQISSE